LYADPKAIYIFHKTLLGAGVRNVTQRLVMALGAASLAACAQSSVVPNKPDLSAGGHQAPLKHNGTMSLVANKRVAVTQKHAPFALDKNLAEPKVASSGFASFYREGTQTASGERFNANEFTAAHRTLPFGTRLQVTNVATGRSVTVRVNDRGPFVPGRVIDVSYSAAETLGIVGAGIAKVKLDVVR
jgi:rare lipoprotein A